MPKLKSTPEYVTREILKEEISASEKRLTAKIGGQIGSVEERLDARITGLDAKITDLEVKVFNVEKRLDAKIETTAQSYRDYTDHRFNQLDTKMTKYFELMMQTLTDGNKGINKILSNHEQRITVLEGREPQPGRI